MNGLRRGVVSMLAALEAQPEFKTLADSAKAAVEGDHLVVTAPGVTKPAAVRFGRHKTTNPNLCNGAGLPASPFRTDAW